MLLIYGCIKTPHKQTNIKIRISCSPRGGPCFPIEHAENVLPLQTHMPAVHTEMMILGVMGGSPPIFGYLERHAQIQNRRQTPSGRKVSGRKEKEKRKRKNNAKFRGHYVCPRKHALCLHQKSINYRNCVFKNEDFR